MIHFQMIAITGAHDNMLYGWVESVGLQDNKTIARHTVVCRAAQEAGAPHP